MPLAARACRECGQSFLPRHVTATFCSAPDKSCRQAFARRRRDRGTELYDLLMGQRFDKSPDAATIVAILDAYRAADVSQRAGRKSWEPWTTVQMRVPIAYGKEGDKR